MVTTKIKSTLNSLKAQNLYRQRLTMTSPQANIVKANGLELINFTSNDYLGLANHKEVIEAMHAGVKKYGVGSGASHLVTGHSQAHQQLEQMFAEFLGTERALLFCSGFMANIGVLDSLLGRDDLLIQDKLNHASLLDGGRLSNAKMLRFPHGDLNRLANLLLKNNQPCLVVSDGVFSMDGDIADVGQLSKLCHNRADLLIDEAHSFGVLGENGVGICQNLQPKPIIMATCGKALGIQGAVVAGSSDLIEFLIQKARSYIYTTAMPASIAHAGIKALKLLQNFEQPRVNLNQLIKYFQAQIKTLGVDLMPSTTPIQPIIVNNAKLATNMSKHLLTQGILVQAIRPSTVPANTSRLRVTLSATHTKEQIDKLILALKNYG